MQKILSQLNQLKAKPDDEGINLKFLRGLPSSWSHYCKKMSYAKAPSFSSSTTYSTLSSSKARSHSYGNVLQDVLYSLVAESEPEQQVAYEDFEQIDKLDLEEIYIKWKMAMLSVRVNKFEKKAGRKIKFDKKEAARFNKKAVRSISAYKNGTFQENADQEKRGKTEIIHPFKIQELGKKDDEGFAPKEYGMVAGCGAAGEEGANEVYSLITGNGTDDAAGEFALMGMTSEFHVARTIFGLGFNDYIGEKELGWDDSAFSVFTTNSEEVEGRPLFSRFAKADSMKAVPPPLFGDYTPLSDHIDLDESQMTYGTNSSTSGASNSMSNDFLSCDNSDKSSEVNINDFASSDSSVISSEPKSKDSTSYASTSSVSTSESEAEIESNVGTPIQEPIIVQDLPSFSCNSSDKNENTSRTSCNKNGYFNKKASHFRKNNSSASKSCFACSSYLHLIKDCNYHETQYANDFDGVGYPQRQPIWDNATRVTQTNQFVPQAVRLRSGKVSIPAARPNQAPAGRPKPVSTGRPKPVSTGKQYKPPPIHAGRRTSSLVTSGWWQSTARPMNHLPTPTSSYFQTFTPFGPHVYYNQMQYDGDGWATAVKPSAGCSWNYIRNKGKQVNLHTDAGDEGIVEYVLDFETRRIEFSSQTLIVLSSPMISSKLQMKARCTAEFQDAQIWEKRIKRDYSNARTPQQNGVAERKNRTLIDAARTMLADSNDHLGKFDGKADEGYLVGYSASNRAYRVYNMANKRVEETMNLRFKEKANIQGMVMSTPDILLNPAGLGFAKAAEELSEKSKCKNSSSVAYQFPTGRIPVPAGDPMVSPGAVSVPTDGVPVSSESSTDSFFNAEPTI
ncbi:ribonuclease H-like domain-containing protein [Tanacetum coccineum]